MTEIYRANGAKFVAKDDMIVRWLKRNTRQFEPVTFDWLFDELSDREGCFVDVGASTGWFSVPAALRGYDVVAFEPNARVQARLLENCQRNGVKITLHKAAASDEDGQAVFWYNRTLPLTSGGSVQQMPTSDALSETVRTVRIDDLVTGRVSAMKIDVEGHELAVLRGAQGVIDRDRPSLVLEANTEADRDALADWLQENEYEWFTADERNMLCRAL